MNMNHSYPANECIFYTRREAARLLGISPDSLTRLMVSGIIKGAHLGNRWKVPKAAILQLAAVPATEGQL